MSALGYKKIDQIILYGLTDYGTIEKEQLIEPNHMD